MKSAVSVSLGAMLKVNLGPFITKIKEDYKPTDDQQLQLLKLCGEFNQGKYEPDTFKKNFFEILKAKAPSDDDFWKEWNAMLTFDEKTISENLALLKQTAEKNNAIVYVLSDTNLGHFKEIQAKSKDLKISTTTDGHMMINDTRLLLSYDKKTDREGLVKIFLDQVTAKEFKITGKINIIHGDPNNYSDEVFKAKSAAELAKIKKLGFNNDNIVVHLHHVGAPFTALLDKVFPSATVVQEQFQAFKIA